MSEEEINNKMTRLVSYHKLSICISDSDSDSRRWMRTNNNKVVI